MWFNYLMKKWEFQEDKDELFKMYNGDEYFVWEKLHLFYVAES